MVSLSDHQFSNHFSYQSPTIINQRTWNHPNKKFKSQPHSNTIQQQLNAQRSSRKAYSVARHSRPGPRPSSWPLPPSASTVRTHREPCPSYLQIQNKKNKIRKIRESSSKSRIRFEGRRSEMADGLLGLDSRIVASVVRLGLQLTDLWGVIGDLEGEDWSAWVESGLIGGGGGSMVQSIFTMEEVMIN